MIDVLIADDEAPALAELAHLLRADPRIGDIVQARSGADALRHLAERAVAVAFLDIHMPGLDGFALAAAMRGLAAPPAIVFVTADDARAVDAFEVRAVDYLLKPVRAERLRRAVDRAIELAGTGADGDDELLPVTVGQAVRFVRRRDVRWVHAQGDYSGCTPTTARTSSGRPSPSSRSGGRRTASSACTARTSSPSERSPRRG